MRGWGTLRKSLFFLSLVATSCQIATSAASASPSRHTQAGNSAAYSGASAGTRGTHASGHGRVASRGRHYARAAGISCVPFARNDSGIEVAGNAWQWWDNAAGVYARGSVPEARQRPRLPRQRPHAPRPCRGRQPRGQCPRRSRSTTPTGGARGMHGGVARNMPVVDVSEANDWSAVRVGLGESGEFGSVYPTYGFIYDRPDTGQMVAAQRRPAPQPDLNPAPSDLRPPAERGWQTYEEVAEAPVVLEAAPADHAAGHRHQSQTPGRLAGTQVVGLQGTRLPRPAPCWWRAPAAVPHPVVVGQISRAAEAMTSPPSPA